MTGEDYEARKDEHRPDWPGYDKEGLPEGHPSRDLRYWHEGFEAGLSAARDVVAALPISGGFTTPEGRFVEVLKSDALTAIDALRGDA